MSYLAIARKWRPLSFDDIVGQRHVTRTLQNAIKLGRIHHAFLFTGPRGVGKTTAARVLARALCCEQGPTAEPCGTCALCGAILAGAAPDVIEIDGASNNSVDDVRELREGVRYLPSQARYRIYIIDEVHMLTKPAFNALLKTLEEPPAHVIFVFATTEPQKIPETILSRVQRFDFKRIPGGQVAERLRAICDVEGVKVSDHALRLVARAGGGSMRDSQSLLDQVISFSGMTIDDPQVSDLLGLVDRTLLYEMLAGLVRGEPSRCLDAIANVHEHGFEIEQFTAELLELLRNAALVAMAPEDRRHLDLSVDEIERLQDLARGLPPDLFARWFDALLEVHDRVARAARPRLVLEMAVARLATVRPMHGMDRIMARLEDLDRRLRHAGATPSPGGRRGGPPPAPPADRGPGPAGPPPGFSDAAPSRTQASAPALSPASTTPPVARTAPLASAVPLQPASVVTRPLGAPVPAAAAPATQEPLPLPRVNPEHDAQARYAAVLDVLEPLGMSWYDLVEHSAVLSWSGEELRVAFSSDSRLESGRGLLYSAVLRPLLERAFPGLRRIETVLREPPGRPATRHEARKDSRARALARLRLDVEQDAAVRALCGSLGFTITEIVPPERIPTEEPHDMDMEASP
jgi:DNA polymerase-3 subunit gamma/tau